MLLSWLAQPRSQLVGINYLLISLELGPDVIDLCDQLLLSCLGICDILQSSVFRLSHPARCHHVNCKQDSGK